MKHTNTFTNLEAFNDATIESPSVSYIQEDKDVIIKGGYHQPTEDKTKAQVGDIVFYNDMIYTEDIEGDTILYMDPKDPRLQMMIESDTCYGIVVIPASHTEDGTVRVVSIDFMDFNNPEGGNASPVNMMWGKYNTNVPGITNKDKIAAMAPGTTTISLQDYSYFATDYNLIDTVAGYPDKKESYDYQATQNSMMPTPYAVDGSVNSTYSQNSSSVLSQKLNGKANTAAIVTAANYTVGDPITNTQDAYPAGCCCASFYHNDDYVQEAGGYYLPSIAELGYLTARYEEIDFTRRALGYKGLANNWYWSSSCYSSNLAWGVYFTLNRNFGNCYSNLKYGNGPVLAFVAF